MGLSDNNDHPMVGDGVLGMGIREFPDSSIPCVGAWKDKSGGVSYMRNYGDYDIYSDKRASDCSYDNYLHLRANKCDAAAAWWWE